MTVRGELMVRTAGMIGFTGTLDFRPEFKRFRGRVTDRPFGEGSDRMQRVLGTGAAWVAREGRRFLAVSLGEDGAYLREPMVYGFEEQVNFENGRVPSDVAPDLDLVHLAGVGQVLLSLPGALRSLEVRADAPVTVPLRTLGGLAGTDCAPGAGHALGPSPGWGGRGRRTDGRRFRAPLRGNGLNPASVDRRTRKQRRREARRSRQAARHPSVLLKELWTLPNMLTLGRIVIIPLFIWLTYKADPLDSFLAAFLFTLAAVTDVIDGWLARRMNLVTVLASSSTRWPTSSSSWRHW